MKKCYGPWAVIAGASEGIGEAFARELAAQGLKCVLIARRQEQLDTLAASLPTESRVVVADLSSPDLQRLLQDATGDLDVGIAVYNAARSHIGPFISQSLEDIQAIIDLNVRGSITFSHVFAARLKARGGGGLVLMTSLTGFWGSPFVATYGATKAFILSLAEALWYELRESHVDVIACCAGATSTPSFNKAKNKHRSMTAEEVAKQALKALGRTPSMVPGAFNRFAAFLLNRLLPRRVSISIMGSQTRALKEK